MLLASMKSMSQKFCTLDPVPVWLLLECFDEIKLVLLFIVNYIFLYLGHARAHDKLLRAKVQIQIISPVSDQSVYIIPFKATGEGRSDTV